ELVATAVLGFVLFRDYLGYFGWLGVAGTVLASVLLSWSEGGIGAYALLLVAGASLCWGFDNHLTALIDGITPSQSTFWKGLAAGSVNLVIGVIVEPLNPDILVIVAAIVVGVFAYGFSISLYILAAQNLGATRSQMIFASAPFFGVILAVTLLDENLSAEQVLAGVILVFSLTILFRDQHAHQHDHEHLHHNHNHRHDDMHHLHKHKEAKPTGYHSHWHEHKPGGHSHPHWPDVHHRHKHE
nr:DMT family transporter [Desulfocapsaceae bacterium]